MAEQDPASETGRIVVSRTSPRDIQIRGLEILLDDKFSANLQFGESYETEVNPGRHRVIATNRMFTKEQEFSIGVGETKRFLAISIPLGGLWLLVAMMGTVAYRVSLEPVQASSEESKLDAAAGR